MISGRLSVRPLSFALTLLALGLGAGIAPAQAAPTITFGPLSSVTIGVAPFGISATDNVGLPVALASTTPQICTVSVSTVTVLTLGTCSITASVAGATSVTQSFAVNPPGIVLGVGAQPAHFSALGTSNAGFAPSMPMTFALNPCPACFGPWTATSNASWVILTAGSGGAGLGSVSFNVFANTEMSARSATITFNAAGVTPVSWVINEDGSTQSMLNRQTQALYQRVLGREPDAGGFSFWTCTTPATVSPCANLGVAGLGQMVDLFLTSSEGFNTDFAVLFIYQGLLGRMPVYAEWSSALAPYRANDTQAGWTAADTALLNTLENSAEYSGKFGSPANTGNVVANVYQNTLNRPPTSAELTAGIATVGSSGLFGLGSLIITGAEYENTGAFASSSAATDHSNKLFVTMMYFSVLARDPDPSGFTFWLGIANGGGAGIYFQPAGSLGANTRLVIEGPTGIVGSNEFQSLFNH